MDGLKEGTRKKGSLLIILGRWMCHVVSCVTSHVMRVALCRHVHLFTARSPAHNTSNICI